MLKLKPPPCLLLFFLSSFFTTGVSATNPGNSTRQVMSENVPENKVSLNRAAILDLIKDQYLEGM